MVTIIIILLCFIVFLLFFIILKLIKMSATDTAVETDIAKLQAAFTIISEKLSAIAADPGNTLSAQSQSDLDAITAQFNALANPTAAA